MLGFYLSLVDTEEEKNIIEELYDKYERLMFSVAYRILNDSYKAQDAVHEAFLRIIKNFSRISFENSKKTKAFVVIVVRNISIDMIKAQKKTEQYEISLDIDHIDRDAQKMFQRLERRSLDELLNKLPQELKEVIFLRYIAEFDIETIASTIGISPQGVYARIRKARKIIKKEMEEDDE